MSWEQREAKRAAQAEGKLIEGDAQKVERWGDAESLRLRYGQIGRD